MIKTTKLKTVYLLEDTKTNNFITVEISNDKLILLNEQDEQEFIFNTENTKETRVRWRNVANLIIKATNLL